jgi:hypothetical protein
MEYIHNSIESLNMNPGVEDSQRLTVAIILLGINLAGARTRL